MALPTFESWQHWTNHLGALHAIKARFGYLQSASVHAQAGLRPIPLITTDESPRWKQQIQAAHEWDNTEPLEVDALVIGSGAGGAMAAWELASRGLAVVILEEGDYYDRKDFNGDLPTRVGKLYRQHGLTGTLGNTFIPVPLGRSVGGTTTINSGTCIRPPDSLLRQWQAQGLTHLTSERLAPLFESVESLLQVQPARASAIGPIAGILDQGAAANALGAGHALWRNAVDCDGQGLCQFGCPTGAKQSTNVSLIPRALEKGALLLTGCEADGLTWAGNRVTGVTAQATHNPRHRLRFNARAVVVSMGSLLTPGFLARNGIRLPWLGRNLSLHPAGAVAAYFPQQHLRNSWTIPQGYGLDALAAQGILFEGATPPLLAWGMLGAPEQLQERIARYQHTAFFGFMIRDSSRGRLIPIPGSKHTLPWYRLNRQDFATYRRASALLARMFLDAGAESVEPVGFGPSRPLSSHKAIDRFFARHTSVRDYLISAYHPLGTARLGICSSQAVCDPTHRVFGTANLYVMDGSNMPSALGANPQITIMTLAMQGARALADQLVNTGP